MRIEFRYEPSHFFAFFFFFKKLNKSPQLFVSPFAELAASLPALVTFHPMCLPRRLTLCSH